MSKSAKNNRVRIIAGDWRGRRLPVADVPGLRPSGDRSRETLFNWLQPWVVGADCADLFAVLIESAEQLQAEQVSLHAVGAMSFIESLAADSLDLVFVDPPFDSNLGGLVLERLADQGCVRPGGFVYVESPASAQIVPPEGWSTWRDQEMGEVRMQLFRCQVQDDERNFPEDGSDI